MLNVYKESILDHVYCTDPEQIINIFNKIPTFGDHRLIVLTISSDKAEIKQVMRRDWRGYTAVKLNAKLSTVKWENDIDQVQDHWNSLERKLVEICDELAPMVPFVNNSTCSSY